MSQLDNLEKWTKITADTGVIDLIKQWTPEEATTNPSLIKAAAEMPEYQELVEEAVDYGLQHGSGREEIMSEVITKLFVNFGCEILKLIPGRVSTEVDARLSFDTEASIVKAREIIALYESMGFAKERILIKLASTWEGIQAAKVLQKEGIHCNMTLMFNLAQAVGAAQIAGAQLISPFVGRVRDWYLKESGKSDIAAAEDPGCILVTAIYNYYKHFGIETEVMGASFRTTGEILELAGCDRLTISPSLLEKLKAESGDVPEKLNATQAKKMQIERMEIDETRFRWEMNEDAMATEKLAEGIRNFAKDTVALEEYIAEKYAEKLPRKTPRAM